MDQIIIKDLELSVHVGVPAAERARPQRLLITVEMEHRFAAAAKQDRLDKTIDYHAAAHRLAAYTRGPRWKLIETLAVELADLILREFKPARVTIEIKKFILPKTRHVAVRITRAATRKFRKTR